MLTLTLRERSEGRDYKMSEEKEITEVSNKKRTYFELLFLRKNEKGVMEALCYDVDISLDSRLDIKQVNRFIKEHLEYYESGVIRKVKLR